MEALVIISQALLYLCFSFLVGGFILLLVPSRYRPGLKIPNRLYLLSTIMLPVFSFIPVLDITLYIAPRIGLLESFKIVLTTYTVGTAWNFTLLGSIVLGLLIASATLTRSTNKGTFAFLGVLLTFLIILTVAWSSHASSIDPFIGIISDFLHLTAVSIWVGILLIIGWFSVNHNNWLKFLSWFSMVAISCLTAIVLSGLFLMDLLVDGYLIDSWASSYGQGLLIKHLFLLPLLFYALANSMIIKYQLSKDITFNPTPWIRVEGFILFTIFMITAAFSQQSPPHGNYLTGNEISPLFHLFHDSFDTIHAIGFAVNSYTICFFFLSILFIGLIVLSFFKKASIITSFLFSCFFVTSIYSMLMVTVVVH